MVSGDMSKRNYACDPGERKVAGFGRMCLEDGMCRFVDGSVMLLFCDCWSHGLTDLRRYCVTWRR